jgi:thiol:disulfide interchange protein DsbD
MWLFLRENFTQSTEVPMRAKNIFLVIVSLWIFSGLCSFAHAQNRLVTLRLDQKQWSVEAGAAIQTVLHARIERGWHINSNKPNDESLIPAVLTSANPSFPLSGIVFPDPKEKNLGVSEKPVSVFEDEIDIPITIAVKKTTPAGTYAIPLQFDYQGCNDRICMAPSGERIELILKVKEKTAAAVVSQDLKSQSLPVEKNPAAPAAVKKADASISSTLEKSGLFLSLLFVFIGGLALNLTPCVYPLIPITVGYFGGQAEGKTGRLFLLGSLYVLGMALTYSVIGVVTALSGAVFGALMQQPAVLIGIAVLFVVLALSQFGVYEFKLPDSWVAKAGGAKGGIFGSFFMGLTMGIVAAPCIGPFVLGLVTYVAAKGDPLYGFLMFFVLAVGLGVPYLLLALFSGKIKRLPRAGDWMVGVKHIFGLLLIALALYFIGPLLPAPAGHRLLPIFGILAALFIFFDSTAAGVRGFKIFKLSFSLLILAVSVYALIPQTRAVPEWRKFTEEAYNLSAGNHERMVVDFSADWCIPCKELDAQTFSDPDVVRELKGFSCYRADMTQSASPAAEQLRNKFMIVGMPTVLIINARGEEVERLTGFVKPDRFWEILKKAE